MSGYIGMPTSYTPVEYIESSGTQYIDTGVLPNQNTGFEIDFTPENPINSSTYGWYLGCNNAITNRLSLNTYPAKSGGELYIGSTAYDPYLTQNVRKHITYKNQVFTDDAGNTYTVSASFSVSVSLYIFNRNDNGTLGGNNPGSMKLYGLKLYDGDTLTRDFIPVLDENNVACLYEKVEEKFYYNKGTGSFAYGTTGQPVSLGDRARKIKKGYVGINNVARKIKRGYVGIPSYYTPIEYIESTGTQYIDTGYTPLAHDKIVVDCIVKSNDAKAYEALFGSRDGSYRYNAYIFFTRFNASNIPTYNRSGAETQGSNMIYNERITLTTQDSVATWTNGTNTYTCTTSGTVEDCVYPLYVFDLNKGSQDGSLSQVKLYSLKIYDGNDNLVRDFIPVLDYSNVACLYEQVEGKFYHNRGAGTFTAGNTTGEPVSLGNKARVCFIGGFPTYKTSFTNDTHKIAPAVTNTDDYFLIAGGQITDGSTPVKTVTAYSQALVASSAADLPTYNSYQTSVYFNGCGIIAGGKTANSGSSRTNNCSAYTNNLTRTALSNIHDLVYEPSSAANSVHFVVSGGCYYNGNSTGICSYDSNFVKTTLTNMSEPRRNATNAAVGDYIVCNGAFLSASTATDFYDNSNVKTTGTNPYGKSTCYPLGLSTKSYAIFFGGSTSESASYAYKDCKAYNQSKVVTSFTLPTAILKAQGFSNGDYAYVGYGSTSYIYDDNLVLQATLATPTISNDTCKQGTTCKDLAMIHQAWSSNAHVFDI